MKVIDIRGLSIQVKKGNGFLSKIENQSFSVNEGDVLLITGPNGCGKSSIVKSVVGDVLDFPSLNYSGEFVFYYDGKPINIKEDEKNRSFFVKNVCYVSQKDEMPFEEILDAFLASVDGLVPEKEKKGFVFRFVLKYRAFESFLSERERIKPSAKVKKFLSSAGGNVADQDHIRAAMFLLGRTKNLSGGQAKLLNILSNLVKYPFAKAILLDEPINNLDYSNVRLFSNILAQIHQEYPRLCFVIITHCRSIPIINRIIAIDPNNKTLDEVENVNEMIRSDCSGCFGTIKDGFYV